ncbi:hypothetical protein BTA51_13310 [Hahella sp. CCB-MM4]|nr:hypothetical protein BTA51_13310 [Hahella sp. CCB-MM4]
MLLLALFASGSATVIHYLEPDAYLLDRILPPVMTVIFTSLLVALRLRPGWIMKITRLTLAASIVALTIPSWFYVSQAFASPDIRLVDSFPPISTALIVVIILIMIFLPTRQAFCTALFAWSSVALPVLIYLLGHNDELWSYRGKDMMISYGPAFLVVLVLIPFHRGLQNKVERLHADHEHMQNVADLDPLTRLFNRRACERHLQQILIEGCRAGVVLFDIDHFKRINDTFGHPTGDAVLKEIADRFNHAIRKDGCVSRWGGEEFLMILRRVDEQALMGIGERLRQVISEDPIEPVGRVTASFGVTMVRPMDTMSSLLERVDRGLYQAKEAGRDCVVFLPEVELSEV